MLQGGLGEQVDKETRASGHVITSYRLSCLGVDLRRRGAVATFTCMRIYAHHVQINSFVSLHRQLLPFADGRSSCQCPLS